MLAPLGAGCTVTLHRRIPSGRDAYGNDTFSTVNVTVDGCAYWPGSAGKNVAGTREYGEESFRNHVVTRCQVMLPAGTTIDPDDEVTTPDGLRWQVSGEGQQWRSQITGDTTGIQVGLERTDG